MIRAMRVLAVANFKGGTGKTTSAVNVAAALALSGHSTALIDLDPQGSAALWFGMQPDGSDLARGLDKGDLAGAFVAARERLDIATGGPALAAPSLTLRKGGQTRVLSDALKAAKLPYAYLVLDCPPGAGDLLYNALNAADGVLVPCEASVLALSGLGQFEAIIKGAQSVNPRLALFGVQPTRVTRTALGRNVVTTIEGKYGPKALPSIADAAAVRDAPAYGETVFEFAPEHRVCDAFRETAARLVEWNGK